VNADNNDWGRGLAAPARVGDITQQVRRVALGLAVVWLGLVAGVGWWPSQRWVADWVDGLAASAQQEAQATARVMDRLFTEMASVANMVASQGNVVALAQRYRTDPPGAAQLTREQRAAQFTRDPLVREVGDFMNGLSGDLQYARIYMNNLSDDTVTASNWADPDSIVGMIYSGRTYLMDALREGSGHSFGIARLNRSLSYFVSRRIEDSDGAPLGSVTVKFDAPEMARYLSGGHLALIVNRQGRVTTSSSPAFMLRNVAALLPAGAPQPSRDGEEPGEPIAIRALPGGHQAGQWLVDGKPYLLHRLPLAHTDYQLLTLASLDAVQPMRRQHLWMALLVAALGLILIWQGSRSAGRLLLRREQERRAALQTSALNTELKTALTDAQTKDRQKVEVLGYVGHDLRAPLATISGYSALLLADADERQRKLLQTIERSAKHQLELIDELLEYAKGELQPLTLQPAATDLPRLLDDVSDYAIALCAQHNNRFRCNTTGPLPRQIILDGKRLQQVLLNLLSNAAKFTRNGAVTLSIAAEPMGNVCTLHMAVRDTGVGIDLSQGIDIFGAFQRIQAASSGTGLGLFIAQRIVSAMGGTLDVASSPGQGATFSFVLTAPVIDASGAGWVNAAQRDAEPHAPAPAPTALGLTGWSEPSLKELADLAQHGRLTDIERWIERHAGDAAQEPLLARLRALLEQFDFDAIRTLALRGNNMDTRAD
jgi:signal transduction histidine kinase